MVDRNFLLAVNRISGALTAVSVVFWLFGGIDFVKEPWAFAVLLIWAETNWRLGRNNLRNGAPRGNRTRRPPSYKEGALPLSYGGTI